MPKDSLSSVVQYLHRISESAARDETSDAALLERFANQRDESAFTALLWRHGPLVLGLCQRMLRHEQDSEDAFQATFLTLARKAGSIGKKESLASWLYKVAYRIAWRLNAKAPALTNQTASLEDTPAPQFEADIVWRDLRCVLDQEIAALPEAHGRAIILCYLEGKSQEEAAHLLGCPKGTLTGRLSRAREQLRQRLTQRGLTLSAGALATLLAEKALLSANCAELLSATVQSALAFTSGKSTRAGVLSARAVALAQGSLHLMGYSKMKLALIVLVAVLLGSSAGVAISKSLIGGEPENPRAEQANQAAIPRVEAAPRDGKVLAEEVSLMQALDERIDTKELQEKVKLKTALEFICDKLGGKLPILVDREAFLSELGADAPDPYEEEVVLPGGVIGQMTAERALRMLVAQIADGKATFVIRRNWIEITTEKHSRATSTLYHPRIVKTFEKRPFSEVVQELAIRADVAINLDPKLDNREKTLISASFRNCSLEEALVTITEMAQLRYVVLERTIFVTMPERTKTMEQEEAIRRMQRESTPRIWRLGD